LKIKMEMEQVKDPNESGFEGVDVIITDSLGTSQTVATDDEEHTKLWCLLDLLFLTLWKVHFPQLGQSRLRALTL
jgi:hypothetical protein